MTEKQAIRTAMWTRRWNQQKLAEKMGYKTQSGIANLLKANSSMRFDNFLKLMDVMDFEITITNLRNPDEQYIIDGEEEVATYDRND